MELTVPDKSNYLRGLLILIGKDKNIAIKEKELFLRLSKTLGFSEKPEGVEISVEFLWDLGIAGMLLGEQKVRGILGQSFENTLANWKDLSEKK